MWIYTRHGFVSIVAHAEREGCLLVRARLPGHLEALFPWSPVTVTPDADYRYRAVIEAELVAAVIHGQVDAIDYPNFKASIPPLVDPHYVDLLHRTWNEAAIAQRLGVFVRPPENSKATRKKSQAKRSPTRKRKR